MRIEQMGEQDQKSGEKDNGVKGKTKRESSLNIRLDAQRHMWSLVFAALDVSFSNGRDVRPGHVIGRNHQRKLESPDHGIENGFDSVRVEYRVGD